MTYLKYFTGDPEQKFKFFELTEKEAKQLTDFLTSENKSSHFEFKGNVLIASRAEITVEGKDFYTKKAEEFKEKYKP